jgi:choline dehydrogenase-like flavoprotein
VYSIDFNAEQEPNRASRVTLGREVDALGMRKIAVDWRYTQGDMRTVRLGMAALAQEIAQSGCGKLLFDREGVQLDAIRDGAYGGHHVGTARMSAAARDGVVNGDCRLHGVGNLYIASSAVFPTSSQANPTLTIVAMALRLAEHLKQRHASTSVVATAA